MMTGFGKLISLLTVCLAVISETPTIQAQGTAEGSIRLRGGINSESGYLGIYHNGAWGRVCDTQWDHNDAHVVCKQEGYNGAKFPTDPFTDSPSTAQPLILDNVQCTGRESSLADCEKGPWGSVVAGCETVKIQCISYLEQHIGCFADESDHLLASYSANCNSGQIDGRCSGCDNTNTGCDSSAMTVEICVEICCTNNDFVYAGLEAGDECFCGDITANYAKYPRLPEVSCNAQCSGNPQQSCGSDFVLDVYDCSSGCGIPEGVMGKANLITNPVVQQTTLYKTGEVLRFSCQAGFQLIGAVEISCQPGGPWSAVVPDCIKQTATPPVLSPCSIPDVPQNGQYTPVLAEYQSGSIVQLLCNSGFELEGPATRTCQRSGTWTPAVHSCKAVPKCPSPSGPSNGQLAPVKVTYDPGESVSFTCSVGYLLQGVGTVICKDDNTWSDDEPTCQMVDCGQLPSYPRSTPSTADTTYQTSVTFACIDRYQFANGQTNPSKICDKDGNWVGNDPVCELRECLPLPGYFKTVRSTEVTTVGTVVSFDCKPGYQLTTTIHTPSKECTRDDVWVGENPVCERSGCHPLQTFPNALPSSNATDIGTTVTFTCSEGTIQVAPGNPTMTCSTEKEWTGTDPNCVEDVDCDPLPGYPNTVPSTNLTRLNTMVTFTCLTGYLLQNVASKTCTHDRGWSGHNPICQNIDECSSTPCNNGGRCIDGVNAYNCNCFLTAYKGTHCEIRLACGQVPSFPNAIPHFEDNLHDVQTTVGYNCSEHFEHKGDKQPSKTCNNSLLWDGPDPDCQAVRCAPPEVPKDWKSEEKAFPVNNTFRFTCTKNKTLGRATMFCHTNGSWDTTKPICVAVGENTDSGGVPWVVWIVLIIFVVLLILLCVSCIVYKVHTQEYAEYKRNEANNPQANVPMQNVTISSPKPIGEMNYGMTNDEVDTGVASNSSYNQDFSMGSEANYPYDDSEYQAGTNDSGMFPSDVESDGATGSGGPDEEEQQGEAGPSGEQTEGNKKGEGDKKDKAFVDDMLDSAKEKLDNCVIQ